MRLFKKRLLEKEDRHNLIDWVCDALTQERYSQSIDRKIEKCIVSMTDEELVELGRKKKVWLPKYIAR